MESFSLRELSIPIMHKRILHLEDARHILIAYMKMKIEDNDWHAVSDAANDLRELDVELNLIRRGEPNVIRTEDH